MKKIRIALSMALVVTFLFPACKKGEKDPFITLSSRDGRITAKWKLTSYDATEVSTATALGITTVTTKTYKFNGSTETITTVTSVTGQASTTDTEVNVYTFEMTLDKRGIVTYSALGVDDNGNSATSTGDGTWIWAGNTKDKDYIQIDLCGSVPFGGLYYIYELKSKELIVKQTDNYGSSSSDGTTDQKNEYTYTFTKG